MDGQPASGHADALLPERRTHAFPRPESIFRRKRADNGARPVDARFLHAVSVMTWKHCAIVLLALGPPRVAAADDACLAVAAREDRLVAVGERGELVFASGERAVLSGVRWADETEVAEAAKSRLLDYRDRVLTVIPRGSQDRWGRMRVDASTATEGSDDLAGGLVADGLAFADAGEGDTLCRPELLSLETDARTASRGVWAGGVRDARDAVRLEGIEGDFVVAEGRVVYVGERRSRTYLNFSRRDEPGLTVTVPKRTWRIMRDRGLTAVTLKGRLVRVRGRVEIWRGPVLDIASADMIEVLDGEQALRR